MRNVYTPTELNREVRLHLEAGFPRLWIEGELSNLARPASGHLYFTLKDEKAQLRCALFRGNARSLGFRPENGQLVQVRGRLGLYEPRGEFQLIADTMEEAGEGRLRAAFERLKRQLQQEGLFDAQAKRPMPEAPRRIGVITSPSGAVIQDMLQVLGRRWPLAQVRLYPVPVQGAEAPPAIVRALEAANRSGWAQALILGRGGGSLEDLWAFNDEAVARTIHASSIPLVSAVGHETDVSISDFVADLRAPTPSAAAELLTPDLGDWRRRFDQLGEQLSRRVVGRVEALAQRLDETTERLRQQHPQRRLRQQRQELEALAQRAGVALERFVQEQQRRLPPLAGRLNATLPLLVPRRQQQLQALARTLHAVSPLPTLERGYSVTLDDASGATLRSIDEAAVGQVIRTRLADGTFRATVEQVDPVPLIPNDGDQP
ncbi:MAG: exodeoxyribonuclease VII large subunit [Pseudomonadota bacterium]